MATVTEFQTITEVVTRTASAAAASSSSANRAPPQGGVLEGISPVHYDPRNPIILFIVQAFIIICFTRLLHWPLSKLRQPRVIAEVIGGILLGPSVLGRIPGFSDTIFPVVAQPNLNLVANLGLTLFLFLVGLEVDFRYLVSNWKVAVSVGVAGMVLPFALGCAIAWGLYNQFNTEPNIVEIEFPIYMLFIGVAISITAFPVLCRILVELKLLHTSVGVIVLSAGIGNDVVGWVLLALCVALVNSGTGNGLTALYVLLTCVGYILFTIYAVRPAFMWVLRRTRSLENGPSQGVIALTLLIALGSAWFTGIIGVHAIFGAFLAGLICPHEGGFATKVTEKIEDLVSALLLPLYFALSGLGTNIGLLDNGITWAYVVGIIVVAFTSKFFAAALAARLNGLVWREAFTVGSLMQCKGLVEIIVLNIGLNARILSTRTFTMFVVMALVTTFATTPMTSYLYPPWYQKKIAAWKRGEIDWETGKSLIDDARSTNGSTAFEKPLSAHVDKLLVLLRIDNMPVLLAFLSLFGGRGRVAAPKTHPALKEHYARNEETTDDNDSSERPIQAHGLRLIELTERDSSVMRVSEQMELSVHDPVVNTFRTFGQLNNIAVSGEVSILPESSFAESLVGKASDIESDLILIPWSETGSIGESQIISSDSVKNKLDAPSYTSFVRETLDSANSTVAVFVNRNFGGSKNKDNRMKLSRTASNISSHSFRADQNKSIPIADKSHHIFFPFFGGSDDRATLRLVLQMAQNTDVTATIIHFETPQSYFDLPDAANAITPAIDDSPASSTSKNMAHIAATALPDAPAERDAVFFNSLRHSLPLDLASRVVFETLTTSTPITSALERANTELGQSPRNAGDLIVLGRNQAHRTAHMREPGVYNGNSQAAGMEESGASECLGVLAEMAYRRKVKGSVLVVQAAGRRKVEA